MEPDHLKWGCVFLQRFCVCTRCVRVHYGDYQTMFLCLYPLRESLEVIQILSDLLVLALSVVQECCLLRHVDSRAKAPRGLDFAPHRHACESSICPRFLARIRGPLRSSLFAGPFSQRNCRIATALYFFQPLPQSNSRGIAESLQKM